jgi:hypothetical protein
MVFILFSIAFRPNVDPIQPPIQWVPGALNLGVKRLGRAADHLHLVPSIRTRGAIPPLLQYVFLAWYITKQGIRIYGVVLS